MKNQSGKRATTALLFAGVFLLLLGLGSCSDGGIYSGGHSDAYRPGFYRSAWDYDRYYRTRIDHYYDRTRQRRAVRRGVIKRRATSGRPARLRR